MQRRNFIRGIIALGACPICARASLAEEEVHWDYDGDDGPEHWGELAEEDAICAAGTEQSPIDIADAITAKLPPLELDWKPAEGTVVNNGHTIQVFMPRGSTLRRGNSTYQFIHVHFHTPSEHHVDGRTFPMEAHFVHQDRDNGAVGVLGVFLQEGARNATFAALAEAFPDEEEERVLLTGFDPKGLLPKSLDYWLYEGSLTTPPCSEIVDWMVAREPLEVAAEDIERFRKIFPTNARPILSRNRRIILSSS